MCLSICTAGNKLCFDVASVHKFLGVRLVCITPWRFCFMWCALEYVWLQWYRARLGPIPFGGRIYHVCLPFLLQHHIHKKTWFKHYRITNFPLFHWFKCYENISQFHISPYLLTLKSFSISRIQIASMYPWLLPETAWKNISQLKFTTCRG